MDLRFDGTDSTDIQIEPSGPSVEQAVVNFKNILASPGKTAETQAAKAMVQAAAGVQDAEPEDRPTLQGDLSSINYALLLREQSRVWPAPHIKALLGLGDAGRRIVLRGLSRGQVPAKALHRSLEGCSILDQVRLLNMVLLRPRGMDPELTAMVWERMSRLLRSHPDECLTLLEELARQGRTLAHPVQKAIVDSAFWVWIKQVLREDMQDEHLAYLARAMSRLQSEECAHELARMLGRCGPDALPEVLNALAQTGAKRDPRLIEAVHGLFSHKSRDVRLGALSALIELGDPDAPKVLAKLAANSPDDVAVLLMACRLDQAGLKPLLSELGRAARREMVARMLSLLSQLKPRALASAARLLAGEDHPQAKAAVADFILAHRERRPRPVRRTAEAELPLYAAPPEPAAPDGGQEGLLKRAAKPAGLAEILESGALVRGGYFAGQAVEGGEAAGAVLDDLVLCRGKLARTRFKESSFSHLDAGRLTMDQAAFLDCEFKGVRLCKARISRCSFQGCAFAGCDFSAAKLEDCQFQDCSFTACQFDYAELGGLRLANSRMEACAFHQAGLADVDGRGVRLDLALFSQARIENMRIQGLDMVECLVEDTRLSGLALEGVDTEGCVFHESELLASDVFAPEFLAMEEAALERALFDAAQDLQPAPDSWRKWDGPALTLAARVVDFWIMHRDASHHARVSLQNNQRRLNWARAKMHPDAAALLTLLPSLLMADLSGHDPGVPCQGAAIVGHTPGFGHQEMLSRLLDKARIAEPSDSDLSAEGLYSIGSTGSIAQTEASDIDLWLVLSPDQDPERVEALRRKLAWIENWAEMSLGLEVHFFVMGLDETRANDFGISDEEGAGSAQALLLKEEFYRTVLCLAGRIPAWWITPPGAGEKAYQRHIRTLGATIDFLGRRVVDLGRLGEIPPGEFFGASLWQIVKALKSPFKSVLKLGLLEKYMDRDKQAGALLCERLKANLLADMHGLWEIDPYALLFKEVNDHYQSRERLEALRLLRTAFLLKTGMGRSGPAPTTASPGVGAGLSEFFFPPHPFSLMARGETADGLESFAARENAGHQVATFMAKAYDRIRKRLGEIQDVSITQQDLTKLGRRISSFFSQRENKITRIPFMNPPKDAFQSLEFTGEVAGGQVRAWIVKGVAPASAGKPGKPEKLRRETEPVRLLGWLVANGIFDPSQYLTIDPNLSPVSSTDMERLLADLHAFFPAKKTFFTDLDQNLKPECVVSAYAAVNLLCARNHETLREAALLYSTNWGELFCLPRTISPEKIATRPLDYLRENIDAPLSAAARIGVFTPPKSKCPKVRLTSIAP